jgi:hypothetical protein
LTVALILLSGPFALLVGLPVLLVLLAAGLLSLAIGVAVVLELVVPAATLLLVVLLTLPLLAALSRILIVSHVVSCDLAFGLASWPMVFGCNAGDVDSSGERR